MRFRLVSVGRDANGLVAIGRRATGLLAVGVAARGVVAIGLGAFGVVAIGPVAVGVIGSISLIGVSPFSIGPWAYSFVPWSPPWDLPVLTHPLHGLGYWFGYLAAARATDWLPSLSSGDRKPDGWTRAVGHGGKVRLEDGVVLDPPRPVPEGPLFVRLESRAPSEGVHYRDAHPAELVVAECRAVFVPSVWKHPFVARAALSRVFYACAALGCAAAVVRSIVWLWWA